MSRRPPAYPGLNTGRLQDLVPFELKVTTTNAQGQKVFTWTEAFSDWCEVQRQSEQTCRFIMHYREGIRPDTHRIIFFGSIWTINNVVHDIKRTMLIIDSDFTQLLEVTHMQSVTREYIDGLPIIRPPE